MYVWIYAYIYIIFHISLVSRHIWPKFNQGTNWTPFCRRHIQMHFVEYKILCFDSYFTELYLQNANRQYVTIDFGDRVTPMSRHVTIWHWYIRMAPGINEFGGSYCINILTDVTFGKSIISYILFNAPAHLPMILRMFGSSDPLWEYLVELVAMGPPCIWLTFPSRILRRGYSGFVTTSPCIV